MFLKIKLGVFKMEITKETREDLQKKVNVFLQFLRANKAFDSEFLDIEECFGDGKSLILPIWVGYCDYFLTVFLSQTVSLETTDKDELPDSVQKLALAYLMMQAELILDDVEHQEFLDIVYALITLPLRYFYGALQAMHEQEYFNAAKMVQVLSRIYGYIPRGMAKFNAERYWSKCPDNFIVNENLDGQEVSIVCEIYKYIEKYYEDSSTDTIMILEILYHDVDALVFEEVEWPNGDSKKEFLDKLTNLIAEYSLE